MADFLWHKVSEKEKGEIEKQAKEIMDGFSRKLSKVGKDIPEMLIERESGERIEGEKIDTKIDREIMFENAPNKNGDFIVGEKSSW